MKNIYVAILLAILALPMSKSICTAQVQKNTESSRFLRNHIAWAGSLAEGDGTLGRDGGEAMFSAMYAHSFTPTLEGEFAFHYMPVQRVFGLGTMTERPFISLSWIFDFSLMVRPIGGLRIGGGISARHLTAVMKGTVGGGAIIDTTDPRNTIIVYPIHNVSYTETASLGINVKVDYLFPISPALDLGVRAQVLLLPLELLYSSSSIEFSPFTTGRGGLGSLGIYLRMNW